MLAAIEVTAYPKQDCSLPHSCSHLLHAALLNEIRSDNPDMSQLLHDDAQVKQFAISTLWPRTRASGDSLSIPKYTECRFRVSTVSRPVFEAFSKAIFGAVARKGRICLNGVDLELLEAGMEHPNGGAATFEELLSEPVAQACIKFVSPTTFRRKGLNVPLPDPGLVYGSLWQKWQAYSDIGFAEEVYDEMCGALALRAANVHTRVWKFPRYTMTGFVGISEFELVREVSCVAKRLFGGLTRMAFFTGVGYRTTMGVGQRRIATGSVSDSLKHSSG